MNEETPRPLALASGRGMKSIRPRLRRALPLRGGLRLDGAPFFYAGVAHPE